MNNINKKNYWISNIRVGSNLYKLLEFIYKKASVYKQDCLVYSLALCNNDKSNASTLLKQLEKRNLIYFKDLIIGKRRLERKTVSVVFITEDGQRLMKHYVGNYEQYKRTNEQFKTTSNDIQVKLYNANRIKTMFNLADISTEPIDKPSLEQLYYHINHLNYTPQVDSPYKQFTEQELEQSYRQGFYYTDKEYKDFNKDISNNSEIISSIFRGLFISANKCLVVYSNGKGNNRMLYLPQENSETFLINNLKKQNFARPRTITSGNNEVKLTISALTVSNTKSFIYSTAIGRRYGRINANAPKTLKTKSIVLSGNSSVISGSNVNQTYNYIYSVVYGKSGIQSLKYLVSHSAEEHLRVSQSLADKSDSLSLRSDITFPLKYKLREMTYPCIYMPVYEIKTLNYIKGLDYAPVIITHKDMTDVISHCTHKQHIFIDIDTIKPMSLADTMLYDNHGYPKGKKMIETYLHEQGLTIPKEEYKNLINLYAMDYTKFYNQVALGRISLSDIQKQVVTIPYVEKRYYRGKKKSIYIPIELYEQMKKYSEEHNITLYTTAIRFFNHPNSNITD